VAASPKAWTRLRPIQHAYLEELAKTGAYGKGKSGVIRYFIETGIVAALQGGVVEKKNIFEFGETLDETDDAET
jgi:hypothetical protein